MGRFPNIQKTHISLPAGVAFFDRNLLLMYAKEQKHFCGKIRRTLPLNPRPTTNYSTYLTIVPAMTEKLLQYETRNEDGLKINNYEEW